ncbi:helix-turn-helix domain-containing protein [Sphingobacterium faecale]|uniref:Helix-turn-helix transcriptional regulator n=1 Tax=Sphingobacterium faecale TaxID=2803775 RepID=A0ABS1R1T4_9SPHI|nr:AraC family transcriptional regulator [Sphingobacterium faecale]MBL1408219.1 helix-turn-helix transcriptional regulator [Sphingobacterium faecale]
MLKSFIFRLKQISRFEQPLQDYLPPLEGSETGYYDEPHIQLIEEYVDYRQVLIYRLQAVVLEPCEIQIECCRSDYHLLYPVEADADIRIRRDSPHASEITLTQGMATYAHIPKAELHITLQPGTYTIHGLLIDIGMIRQEIFRDDHFLMQFRLRRQQNKKLLYQSAQWPIAEKTLLQIQHIENFLFPHHKDKEGRAVELVYTLFDIAEYKQFEQYEKLQEGEILAGRIKQYIEDQVNKKFSIRDISHPPNKQNLSYQQLARIFKKYNKKTMIQYRDELLLAKAKILLLQYDVSNVAYFCGFNQISAFSDFFFSQTNIRPSVYKCSNL